MKKSTDLSAAFVTPVLGIKSSIFPSPENLEKIFLFQGGEGQGNQSLILVDQEFFLPVENADNKCYGIKRELCSTINFSIYFHLEKDFLIRVIAMFHNRWSIFFV